jgi:hypothetical protein
MEDKKAILSNGSCSTQKPTILGWVLVGLVILVLALGTVGYWVFNWPGVLVIYFGIVAMALIGIPAGIRYGTQKKNPEDFTIWL